MIFEALWDTFLVMLFIAGIYWAYRVIRFEVYKAKTEGESLGFFGIIEQTELGVYWHLSQETQEKYNDFIWIITKHYQPKYNKEPIYTSLYNIYNDKVVLEKVLKDLRRKFGRITK